MGNVFPLPYMPRRSASRHRNVSDSQSRLLIERSNGFGVRALLPGGHVAAIARYTSDALIFATPACRLSKRCIHSFSDALTFDTSCAKAAETSSATHLDDFKGTDECGLSKRVFLTPLPILRARLSCT